MNFDFKIPMSGKVARRLAYLNTILPLELDPRIMNHVTRDLLDPQVIARNLTGTTLLPVVNIKQQELLQFIADTDYRAVIGGTTEMEVVEIVLASALASDRDLVIISDANSIAWEGALAHFNVDYVTEADPLQPITAKVVVVKSQEVLETMKQHGRERILLYIPHHYDFDLWYSKLNSVDPMVQALSKQPNLLYTIDNIGKEFPNCIMGFYLSTHTEVDKIKYWSKEKRVVAMVNAINCDNRISQALSLDTNNQSVLLNSGFTRRLPAQIGKILNVNVDMLTARTYFFEDDNEQR